MLPGFFIIPYPAEVFNNMENNSMIGWDFFIALVARLWYNGFKGDNGMIYYGMITAAVAMFSIQFFFKNIYRNARGSGTGATLEFSALSSLAGMAVLFIMNGLRFEFTAFSLLMAALSAVNSISFTFCSLTALGKINLSLYSVFSMLGGMVLPFAAGIIFFDEPLRAGKIVCLLFITAALCVTIQRDECRSGTGYYIGVFALNGMSGVLSKIFQASPFEKTSAAGYSVLSAASTVVIACALLPFFRSGEKRKLSAGMIVGTMGNGILGCIANLLLLISLAHLPASAQYPFVTGGVMIMSTALCFFTSRKPRARELVSVALAFAGMLALVLID